jgi:hypothetical protein
MRKAALIVGSVVALVVAAPASAGASPLAGWWPFYEGNGTLAHDATFNHDNGTASGAFHWTGGYFGPAISIDGASGQVRVPDNPVLEPANAVSVTAFVKASGSPGPVRYIVAKGGSGCDAASYGLYTGLNGGVTFYVSHNGGLSFTRSPAASNAIWDGDWHFVVGTYDGSSVRLYVDGTQVGTGSADSGPIGYGLSSDNDLYVGHYPSCGDLGFAGSIDEPTVWSRALSPSEVSFAYKALVAVHRFVSRLPSFPGS